MKCGQCKHWDIFGGSSAVVHIRLGSLGECSRVEGECQNERGQYRADDEAPRLRFENEPAGAHYVPIAAKAGS